MGLYVANRPFVGLQKVPFTRPCCFHIFIHICHAVHLCTEGVSAPNAHGSRSLQTMFSKGFCSASSRRRCNPQSAWTNLGFQKQVETSIIFYYYISYNTSAFCVPFCICKHLDQCQNLHRSGFFYPCFSFQATAKTLCSTSVCKQAHACLTRGIDTVSPVRFCHLQDAHLVMCCRREFPHWVFQ